MDPNVGYVIAAYVITAVALGWYAWSLFARIRSAARRADAVARRR